MQATTTFLQRRYEIVRPIAQGGMGAVYEGRDWHAGGAQVALKLCVFDTAQRRAIGEREAQRLVHLSHPNLPKVRDVFSEGAGQYLVMEFVEGRNLAETLQKFGQPLDHRTVLKWADQLLDALSYLHSAEPPVWHRDIKPANVKLTPQGQVMLLDFGFNLSATDDASAYVPLEQMNHDSTDARADLYALGATLFRLLTGVLPESASVRLAKIASQQPDPQRLASELVPTVPLMVAQALARALALNREERFQSASEMREALRLAFKTAPPTQRRYDQARGQASSTVKAATPSDTNPRPSHRPVVVSAARKIMTTTVPMPAANLAQRQQHWQVLLGLATLVFGGVSMGLLAQQFLGRSNAEPPAAKFKIKAAAEAGTPATAALTAQFTNRFGTPFTLVPAGHFTMGAAHEADAQPPHIVTFAQPFYLGTREITQQQWRSLMRQNPSLHKGETLPVENVSWFDVQKYIAQINLMSDGYRYRLPTEAEWEYAARAGQPSSSDETAEDELTRLAWYAANTKGAQPVGQKEANAFGLHDMLGNVAEWCADAYHESYVGVPADGEAWTAATGLKLFRVIRGESWLSAAKKVHPAYRSYDEPHHRSAIIGFRLVAEKMPETATP